MGWWIIVGGLVLVSVLCLVYHFVRPNEWRMWNSVLGWLCIILAFNMGLIIAFCPISARHSVAIFKQQKQYIESHQSDASIEDAMITTTKIEMNSWLYDSQWNHENYGIFTFVPDEVMDITPID